MRTYHGDKVLFFVLLLRLDPTENFLFAAGARCTMFATVSQQEKRQALLLFFGHFGGSRVPTRLKVLHVFALKFTSQEGRNMGYLKAKLLSLLLFTRSKNCTVMSTEARGGVAREVCTGRSLLLFPCSQGQCSYFLVDCVPRLNFRSLSGPRHHFLMAVAPLSCSSGACQVDFCVVLCFSPNVVADQLFKTHLNGIRNRRKRSISHFMSSCAIHHD